MKLGKMQFFCRSHDCIFIMYPFDSHQHTIRVRISRLKVSFENSILMETTTGLWLKYGTVA